MIDGEKVWIIDPGDAQPIISHVAANRLDLQGVLLTHCHFDHIYGLNELCTAFSQARVFTNSFGADMLVNDRKNLSRYHETPFLFEHSQNIVLTDGLTEVGPFKVHETPGHNPSCLTFSTDAEIFTGDAYIPGLSVVTNLPYGDKVQAHESVQKILKLAKNKAVYPGHRAPFPQKDRK